MADVKDFVVRPLRRKAMDSEATCRRNWNPAKHNQWSLPWDDRPGIFGTAWFDLQSLGLQNLRSSGSRRRFGWFDPKQACNATVQIHNVRQVSYPLSPDTSVSGDFFCQKSHARIHNPGFLYKYICLFYHLFSWWNIGFAVVFQGKKEDTIITAREYDRKARGEVRAGSAVSRERMLSQ